MKFILFILFEQRSANEEVKEYILLGITCEGVVFLNPETKEVLHKLMYPEIEHWGFSDDTFMLVKSSMIQQESFIFETTQVRINDN